MGGNFEVIFIICSKTTILSNFAFRLDGSYIFHVPSVPDEEKNISENIFFFGCVFCSILELFPVNFGRVLGGVWGFLGVSGALFDVRLSVVLVSPMLPKRRPGCSWASFWMHF